MANFLKKNWIIILLVFLALALRLWGVNYGLPGLFVGDEKSLVGGALKMIFERNIFPVLNPAAFRILYYPVLIPWIYLLAFVPYVFFVYLTGSFASIAELRDFFIINPANFFLMARLINVFFSAGWVYLIFLITKKMFSKRAGLIAALLAAVAWLPIHQGHFSKHWNIGIFFALLVLAVSFLAKEKPSLKNYLLAGVFVGLAGFANYVSAVYAVFLIFIHFLFREGTFREKFLSKKLWLFILVSLIIFCLGVLAYPQEFYRMTLGEDSTAVQRKSIFGFLAVVSQVFKTMYYLEAFILILSLIGFLILFFKDKRKFLLMFFIPFLTPFLCYFFLHFEPRYVLLFLPLLAITAGFGLDELLKMLKIKSGWLTVVVCLAIVVLPLKNALVFDKMLTQADTRNLARQWIEENLAAGTRIIVNSWEFDLFKNQECLEQQQQTNNMSLRSRDYVMMARSFPDSYCVWNLDLIRKLPPDVEKYQYYLIDEYTGRRLAYLGEELMKRAELVKKFEGSPFDPASQAADESDVNVFVYQRLKDRRLGPTVEIYRLK